MNEILTQQCKALKNARENLNHSKTSFCVGEYVEYGFDQQRLICYVCRVWDMVFS